MPNIDDLPWLTAGHLYSVDVDCRNTTLVTGSVQGVKVWNLAPVLSTADEADAAVCKLLAHLTDHQSDVLIVRFSPDGRRIASGGDDRAVHVYEIQKGAPGRGALGSSSRNIENWKKVGLGFRGHSADVTGLAWSPDGRLLASCSVDNTVVVWDVATQNKVIQLKGHQSSVKGVAWDPLGKYLVSQAEDKCMIVWRTDSWSEENRVCESFPAQCSSAMFMRCHFSPDGQQVVAVNSLQKGQHTAVMWPRGKYSNEDGLYTLAGHLGALVCARFSPRLYYCRQTDGSIDRDTAGWRLALGGIDDAVSLYTKEGHSGFAVKKLPASVRDLAWTADGLHLIVACTTKVIVIRFSEEELSEVLPRSEEDKLIGDLASRVVGPRDGQRLPESAAQLHAFGIGLLNGVRGPERAPLVEIHPSGQQPARPQLQLLQHSSNNAAAAIPAGSVPPTAAPPVAATPLNSTAVAAAPAATGTLAAAQPGGTAEAQAAPQPAEAAANVQNDAPSAAAAAVTQAAAGRIVPPDLLASRMGTGTVSIGGHLRVTLHVGLPRKASGIGDGLDMGARPIKARRVEPEARATLPAATALRAGATAVPAAPATLQGALAGPTGGPLLTTVHVAAPNVDMQVPVTEAKLAAVLQTRTGTSSGSIIQEVTRVEVINAPATSTGRVVSEVICSQGDITLWRERVEGRVLCLAGSPDYVTLATDQWELLVYTSDGQLVLPAIHLSNHPVSLASNGDKQTLVATADAMLQLWDWERQTVLAEKSFLSLLVKPQPGSRASLVAVRFSQLGLPLVFLSNHQVYALHQQTVWTKMSADSYPQSMFQSRIPDANSEVQSLQAPWAAHSSVQSLIGAAGQGRALQQAGDSRAHLQLNLAASRQLGNALEYRTWLATYTRHLATAQDEQRLRGLCLRLAGPSAMAPASMSPAEGPGTSGSGPSEQLPTWEPQLLGMNKHALLRETVLPEIQRKRELQRLYNELQQMLGDLQQHPTAMLVEG